MGNERDDDDLVEVKDLHTLWTWVFFTMGATSQAAFVKSGDEARDARSQEAAISLGQLVPAIAAALNVAMAHEAEFWEQMKGQQRIFLKKVKW